MCICVCIYACVYKVYVCMWAATHNISSDHCRQRADLLLFMTVHFDSSVSLGHWPPICWLEARSWCSCCCSWVMRMLRGVFACGRRSSPTWHWRFWRRTPLQLPGWGTSAQTGWSWGKSNSSQSYVVNMVLRSNLSKRYCTIKLIKDFYISEWLSEAVWFSPTVQPENMAAILGSW